MKNRYYFYVGIASLVILTVLIFLFIGRFADDNVVSQENKFSKIEALPMEYNAGVISMANGPISMVYTIKNIGNETLKISKIWTSCACTKAIMEISSKKSPEFSMHTNFFWTGYLKPGEEGQLEVVFDPAFHGPSGIGDIIRIIRLTTNDPENKEFDVKLYAKVIP